MEAALRAIAEPRRRRILELVRAEELSAGEIASQFEVTRPAISQHLGVLKEAGLVDERRNGTQRLYRARPQGLAELKAFLEAFWDERLEALQREAEREERKDVANATETSCVERELSIAAQPGDGVGAARRPGEGSRPGWGMQSLASAPRPGGPLPRRGHPRPHRARRVRRGRSAEPARLHVGLGGRRQSVPPGSSTVEIALEQDGDGTKLTFVHSGLPSEEAAGVAHARLGQLLRAAQGRGGGRRPGRDPFLDSMK